MKHPGEWTERKRSGKWEDSTFQREKPKQRDEGTEESGTNGVCNTDIISGAHG